MKNSMLMEEIPHLVLQQAWCPYFTMGNINLTWTCTRPLTLYLFTLCIGCAVTARGIDCPDFDLDSD